MKPYSTLAAALLALIALLQLTRCLLAWPVTVNGMDIPLWASALAAVVMGVLSVLVWSEAKKG
jgi:hypothetical protein